MKKVSTVEKVFNYIVVVLSLFFIWTCSDSLFHCYHDGQYGLAALNVVNIVIFVGLLEDTIHDMQKINSQKFPPLGKFDVGDEVMSMHNPSIVYKIHRTHKLNDLDEYDYVCEYIGEDVLYKGKIFKIAEKKMDEWGIKIN